MHVTNIDKTNDIQTLFVAQYYFAFIVMCLDKLGYFVESKTRCSKTCVYKMYEVDLAMAFTTYAING